ncbi:MAG TPA: Holliday junction resolvase RuvX [Hungateiclostridium thermocellum]|jgi:putative Holliday junction resolvase|uniref:Putative pre-16S rRNA nuclease n=2 Tax=Acetivibrio thermocellus TaxID=1515 RepID=YQGF_ACET2|nr:Holliday junction resolvase RuvX [Acetivibrio thermocellus]A3DBR5.1 RecName: Full=Putative pre-16S rRNA nuclease [Acetivibrio thermocellus ATCC 27405]CDG34833.1 putative Holliday junction resolvase [Acetivibrio thermocellus BC1]ABN51394.1 Holliday junction resolvase YqgF [Acetivibrio thermocellus ATCC 27405]ADU75121.1 Holliday junction resolvase YqgF [Acetivibrio thermocellus DSM 1313]ALX09096.1 Holliday junction resolvase [Acetivibrio thermocellus AD2]ANV76848.1 Holliday junction resolvas
MRVLGIDYGDSRIGIAISDPLGWTAQALETITWRSDVEVPLKRISELVEEYGVKTVIVGFPKNMDGTVGARGEKTIEFIDLLQQRIKDIEVIKWDERLTTVAANRTMYEMGIKKSKKKLVVDQIAAVYILQGYLDSKGKVL